MQFIKTALVYFNLSIWAYNIGLVVGDFFQGALILAGALVFLVLLAVTVDTISDEAGY